LEENKKSIIKIKAKINYLKDFKQNDHTGDKEGSDDRGGDVFENDVAETEGKPTESSPTKSER